MVTNFSQYDKVKGREVWAVPICLILGAGLVGLVFGGLKYLSKDSHYQALHPEVRAVQSQEIQDFCSRDPNDLERLIDKYGRQR